MDRRKVNSKTGIWTDLCPIAGDAIRSAEAFKLWLAVLCKTSLWPVLSSVNIFRLISQTDTKIPSLSAVRVVSSTSYLRFRTSVTQVPSRSFQMLSERAPGDTGLTALYFQQETGTSQQCRHNRNNVILTTPHDISMSGILRCPRYI